LDGGQPIAKQLPMHRHASSGVIHNHSVLVRKDSSCFRLHGCNWQIILAVSKFIIAWRQISVCFVNALMNNFFIKLRQYL
jgi:hypothetical protein